MQSWCDETPSDDVPIIDYHCHLDGKAIKEDKTFSDIGELWLSGEPLQVARDVALLRF